VLRAEVIAREHERELIERFDALRWDPIVIRALGQPSDETRGGIAAVEVPLAGVRDGGHQFLGHDARGANVSLGQIPQ
jgi:hypothetical protein